eukprot:3654109-Lingulodinium_polyedra.AAC.1
MAVATGANRAEVTRPPTDGMMTMAVAAAGASPMLRTCRRARMIRLPTAGMTMAAAAGANPMLQPLPPTAPTATPARPMAMAVTAAARATPAWPMAMA